MNERSEKASRILVADDDVALGKVLVSLISQAGFEAKHVDSGEAALEAFGKSAFDLVVTDVRMKKMDGIELLRELKRAVPTLPVIVLTAHGSISMAVEAMRLGAADFMTKPFDREEILFTLKKALAFHARAADAPPEPEAPGVKLAGSSPVMKEISDLVQRAARAQANVLIRGESGTGKEVVARSIHDLGRGASQPFVAVNCAAVPEQLLESEIFGYEKGAFTGAVGRRPGRVELARGGTLFLDEIGDVPLPAQAKLLRLLQEKEYTPLGGTRTEKADVRFIAATHRDLEQMIKDSEFREDLYYRLNVIPIWLPPLRDRGGDLAELAAQFAEALGRANGRTGVTFEKAALEKLATHAWPGNVRELMCVIERLIVFTDGPRIEERDVARELERLRAPTSSKRPSTEVEDQPTSRPEEGTLLTRRNDAEREAVLEALGRAKHNRTQAARLLGISRRTLYKRLAALGIADA